MQIRANFYEFGTFFLNSNFLSNNPILKKKWKNTQFVINIKASDLYENQKEFFYTFYFVMLTSDEKFIVNM